jgi:hypothetical protein
MLRAVAPPVGFFIAPKWVRRIRVSASGKSKSYNRILSMPLEGVLGLKCEITDRYSPALLAVVASWVDFVQGGVKVFL